MDLDLYRLADEAVAGQRLPMMLFPLGTFKSAKYPKLPLTRELADELIANFEAGTLGTEPVVDSSGRHDESTQAAGWVKRLYVAGTTDGREALYADWEPTDLGAELLNAKRYQYNSVHIDSHTDNETGAVTPRVLKGVSLTNTPVLRILPPVLEAGERIAAAETVSIALSEIEAADDDPVAALLDEMDALAAKLDESLRGKRGMPSMRTLLREARSKVSAHKLTDDDTTPQDEVGTQAAETTPSATAEPVGDGAVESPDGPTDKERKQMSELTEFLKLAEDADEALILAEVKKVSEQLDVLLAEKAEAAKAERVRALDEAIGGGHILPAEKDSFLKLAESAPETFAEMIDARKDVKVIDLAEHGSGDAPVEPGQQYENASVELAEKAKARAAADGITYEKAEKLVLSEDADLRVRYAEFRIPRKED